MANELYFDIRLALNDSDERTVRDRLNTIHREANEASQGSTEAKTKETKATQEQVNAEKKLIKEFQRKVTLNEVQFRQGKLSQKAALAKAEAIERQAIKQGILTDETLQGVRAQKTMFLSQQRISTGFTGMASASARANQSLMNLGRIVQDLPFGFLGISNNIDPALDSFNRLREESGSAGAAFKALLGALKGPGGLIFAVGSVLPSAILIAQKGWNMYSKSAKKAKENTDLLKGVIGEFIDASADLIKPQGFSFLNKSDIESEIEAMQGFKTILNDISDLRKEAFRSGSIVTPVGLVRNEQYSDQLDIVGEKILSLKDKYGLTDESIKNFNIQLDANIDRLKILNALTQENPLAKFREELEQTTQGLLDKYNTGLLRSSEEFKRFQESTEDVKFPVDLLRKQAGEIQQTIIDLQRGDADVLESLGISEEDTMQAIKFLQDQLSDLKDFVPEKPLVPILPPKDEIIDNLNELNLLLSDARIQPIEIEIFDENFEQEAKERAAVLARINKDATEQRLLDLYLERKAFENAMSEQLETARYVAHQRVMLERNVMGALQSLSQGFAQDNKALAIGLLAVEKGLAIAQVVINGIKEAGKASALAASWTAMGRFDMAGIATGMAVKIKALTAANVAAIAAQGIGEAVNISNRGSRSGGIASGGAGGNSKQYGFFTSDREPKRPTTSQSINIFLEGEFDDEMVSVKARRGDEKRKRGAFFTV